MDDSLDNILFSILQDTKTIPNFFDSIFGFLFRRTDFYHISNESNLGIGLPEGVAEKLLFDAYKKYLFLQNVSLNEASSSKLKPLAAKKAIEPKQTKQATPNNYNGAAYENYSWSQSISDIDVNVKIPHNVNSRQLIIEINSTNICVKLKNSDQTLLSGEFCRKCKTKDTIWSIDDDILQIHLEKTSESWWDCLIQSEPRLDYNKMDCSRPFCELSDEAQAKIEELQWKQERNRQGLQKIDELDLEKTLKKSWNAEGSPFSGPFDPTKVSFT